MFIANVAYKKIEKHLMSQEETADLSYLRIGFSSRAMVHVIMRKGIVTSQQT